MSQHYAMAGPPGSGPEGETCGTCKHRYGIMFTSRRVYKCAQVVPKGSSAASDLRLKWPACRRWEQAK